MKPFKNTKDIGDYGEMLAARYLRRHGYLIKERNWRTGHLEIDIIAQTWRTVAFVEVKTRTYTEDTIAVLAPPKTAVHAEKQRLTRRAAREYLFQTHSKRAPRMDVIEISLIKKEDGRICVADIHHIKGAY